MGKELNRRKINTPGGLEILRAEGEEKPGRKIKGCAIVFDTPTELYRDDEVIVRETIAPEAVTDELLRESDIIMTMHHNPEKVLARSKQGKGTLTYSRDAKGVYFEFEAPNNADGDAALESVSRGDIDGCSFWAYLKEDQIERSTEKEDGVKIVNLRIKGFDTIRDFTLTPTPQYTETECEALRSQLGKYIVRETEAPEIVSMEAIEAIEEEARRIL